MKNKKKKFYARLSQFCQKKYLMNGHLKCLNRISTNLKLTLLLIKGIQVHDSKEFLYLIYFSVNDLESVLLFVVTETVLDDFKIDSGINFSLLLEKILVPFF